MKTLATGDSTPNEGDTVAFQIVVTNNGSAQATNVSLNDSLPAGITYDADATSQGNYDPATGFWTIGTLNDGASAILTLEGTVNAGQGGNTIQNITTPATGDQPDPTTFGDDLEETVVVNNVTPPAVANLVTVKEIESDSTPDVGDVVHYHVFVTNNGSSTATNVSLVDLLPPGLTPTAINGQVTHGTYNATTGLWNIGTLAVNETASLDLDGIVNACLLYTSPSPRDATLSRMPSSA